MCFLAGRAIATRVATTPAQPTDGLFYFITDHTSASSVQALGSTRLLATTNGSPVQGTTAHYLPLRQVQCRLYGDYRGSAPTATSLTERGRTGHHASAGSAQANREIGMPHIAFSPSHCYTSPP